MVLKIGKITCFSGQLRDFEPSLALGSVTPPQFKCIFVSLAETAEKVVSPNLSFGLFIVRHQPPSPSLIQRNVYFFNPEFNALWL